MIPRSSARGQQLKFVCVGHVDHGKSTLIGRLLHDTGSLPEGKLEELKLISERRGMPLEWSFVLDSFQAERDQAVTIDTTQIWFKTARRDCVIIDAPGHREFLKNMVSGAALADAAVLVIDAEEGVREQSRRHVYLLHLLGLRQIAVVINKMDRVGYAAERFAEVRGEIVRYLDDIGLAPSAVIPISARHGDNLAAPSSRMLWYGGGTLLEALDRFEPMAAPVEQPLRFPIQDVYKFDERRILVGRIATGVLRVGDTLLFSPSNLTARVKTIEAWNAAVAPVEAKAGQSIGITLDDGRDILALVHRDMRDRRVLSEMAVIFDGAGEPRVLGVYTQEGIHYALEQYGFLSQLERLGYRADVAASGLEVLAALA